jgi:hypothetical protein
MLNAAHAHAELVVYGAHPLGVSFGEIVIDCDYVDTVPGESVKIGRQGGDQGFAFAGFHFGDLSLMENDSPSQLLVVMPHLQCKLCGAANCGKRFWEEVIKGFSIVQPPLEFFGLATETFAVETLKIGFKRIYLINYRLEALEFSFVRITPHDAEELFEHQIYLDLVEHGAN